MLEPELAGEATDVGALVAFNESDADAGPSGPAGAADAMDVALVVLGRIEVDHVRDPGHIDPARRHVGGHERVDGTGLEPVESRFALALGLVAVHGDSLDAVR